MVAVADGCCGADTSRAIGAWLSVVKEEEEEENDVTSFELRVIKDERVEVEVEAAAAAAPAVPMDGLHEAGPPPFLNKTFQMVDDPGSDDVVSWSVCRDSFVVWDSHEFSKNLLPKYFKHSNFSSFIRQLNTYGFKKVDPDRWEFANKGFQGGQRHLLKTIKRRSKYNRGHQHHGKSASASDSASDMLETELDALKQDQHSLRAEIQKLRQEQEESHEQLAVVEERIRCAECRQNQLLLFFTKTITNPSFFRQLIKKRVGKREIDGSEIHKRKRILSTPDPEIQSALTDNLVEALEESVFSDDYSYNDVSENLLDEISVLDEELSVNDSKFYNELEDLVEKPRDWGGYITSLVEQTGCISSML